MWQHCGIKKAQKLSPKKTIPGQDSFISLSQNSCGPLKGYVSFWMPAKGNRCVSDGFQKCASCGD